MYFDTNLIKLIKGTYSYFFTLSDKRYAILAAYTYTPLLLYSLTQIRAITSVISLAVMQWLNIICVLFLHRSSELQFMSLVPCS